MKTLRPNRFAWAVSAAFIVTLLAMPSLAHATATRLFPAGPGCQPFEGAPALSSNLQWYNTSSPGYAVLLCPIISDPTVAIPAVSPLTASIIVNGYSNGYNGGIGVAVCAQAPGGGVPTCSAEKWATTAGSVSLSANLPTMSAGDYVYMLVLLSPVSGGSYSTFWGYALTNQ